MLFHNCCKFKENDTLLLSLTCLYPISLENRHTGFLSQVRRANSKIKNVPEPR